MALRTIGTAGGAHEDASRAAAEGTFDVNATPAIPRLLLLMGTPQVRHGETTYPLPDSLPGYLVAYLAYRADWVPREQLATLCWPDATEEDAQHNLRVNLNRLRPHLRTWGIEPALVAERRRVRLDLPTDTGSLRDALGAGDWNAAAALPRGPFLHGITFRAFPVLGEWARTERESLLARWREAVLAAAPPLAPAAAGALAERYLEHDPYDEEVLRVQLAALATLGRAEDAQRAYERFRARSLAELGFGPSATLDAFLHGIVAAPSTGAPAAADEDALIGRERDLQDLIDALPRQRAVVLAGLGGVGKTRLAREAVPRAAAVFPGGIWWVDAAALSGPAQIARRLADLAHLPGGGGPDPVGRLAERIGEKPALLLLDNAEALLGERAALLAMLQALLDASPVLHVLATSRETLGLAGEHVVRLDGLGLPSGQADVLEAAAVRLFVAHARRARPGFDPRGAVADLATIARLTGGLPLALRLAAGWIRLIDCAQVAQELKQGLAALDAGDGRSVRAALDGSWNRLPPAERQVLARMAAFAGEFDLDDARRVADAGLPVLASLVDRSLLCHSDGEGRARFEQHPLVRQFAREKLQATPGDAQQTFERHAVLLAQRLAGGAGSDPQAQHDAVARVGARFADVMAAWSWSAAAGRSDLLVQVTPALARFFETKGRWDEGIPLFEAAETQLDAGDPQERAALAVLQRSRGTLLYRRSDYDAAEAVLRSALEHARALGHRAGIRMCLNVLGLALWMQGRYAEARGEVAQAQAMAQEDGDPRSDAKLSSTLALLDKAQGDVDAAEAGWRRALELNRLLGDWEGVASLSNNLGNLLRGQEKLDAALALLEEGLRVCDEHGLAAARSFLLINIALVHLDAGRTGPAKSFAELALDDCRRAGERKLVSPCHMLLAYLALAPGEYAAAAAHLVEALRLTRALGDVQNQLEALDGFGRWLDARGERARAAALWTAIGRHPKLQDELRRELDKRWGELALDAAVRERAERDADAIDLVAATEHAIRELTAFGAHAGGGAPARA